MKFVRDVLVIVICVYLVVVINTLTRDKPRDSTDLPAPAYRSGIRLFTDHLTGCQYVQGDIFGGITPRMGANGKQLCGGDK